MTHKYVIDIESGTLCPDNDKLPFQRDPCTKAMAVSPTAMIPMLVGMQKSMGFKNPGKCPLEVGNYTMRNYVIDLTYEVPFFSGRFRATPTFRRIATKKKIFARL